MIAAGLEIALAVSRLEETGAALQDCDKAGDGALGQFSQRALQFGDRHLDGVEVRAVGGRYRTVQFFLTRISATLGLL